MVAGNREAADAGAAVLAAGGNAADAAAAAGLVLSVTNVDVAGLGGAAVALVVDSNGFATVIGVADPSRGGAARGVVDVRAAC